MNAISPHHNGYSDSAQAEKLGAHKNTATVMRRLAALLELPKGTFEIRSNKGGIAVPGEVTLHSERVYVQCGGYPHGVLVRSCKGIRDYSGGRNHWFSFHMFENDLAEFAKRCRPLMAQNLQLVIMKKPKHKKDGPICRHCLRSLLYAGQIQCFKCCRVQ